MRRLCALTIGLLLAFSTSAVRADAGPPTAILTPEGSGAPVANAFLVRNERRFREAGIETAIAERPAEAVEVAGAVISSKSSTIGSGSQGPT